MFELPLKILRHQKNIAVVHLRGQALVNEPARNALAQSIHAAQASILVVVVTDPLRAQVAQNRPPQSGPKTFGLAAVGDVGKILVAKEPILVAPEPIVAQEPILGAPANLATKMETRPGPTTCDYLSGVSCAVRSPSHNFSCRVLRHAQYSTRPSA